MVAAADLVSAVDIRTAADYTDSSPQLTLTSKVPRIRKLGAFWLS
jgi:hypothetical protein